MSKEDITLYGRNLKEFDCSHGGEEIHPQTCTDQVLIGHNGSFNLTEWITTNGGFGIGTSLMNWLQTNFQAGGISVLPSTGSIVTENYSIHGSGYNSVAKPTPTYFLREDSSWAIPANFTEPIGSTLSDVGTAGFVPAANGTQKGNFLSTAGWSTLPQASSSVMGCIKLNYTTSAVNRNYGITVDADGNAYVNVPWVSGTGIQDWSGTEIAGSKVYDLSSAATLATPTVVNNRLYPICIDDNNKLLVVVPWTDTIYTAGSNININNNVISATDTTYSAGTNISIENNTINNTGLNNRFYETWNKAEIDLPYIKLGLERIQEVDIYVMGKIADSTDLSSVILGLIDYLQNTQGAKYQKLVFDLTLLGKVTLDFRGQYNPLLSYVGVYGDATKSSNTYQIGGVTESHARIECITHADPNNIRTEIVVTKQDLI